MVEASCHCGAVRLMAEAAPAEVNACSCSICRRYGTLWAYYPPSQVKLAPGSGPTDIYMWGDRNIAFHRCRACGCVTHWSDVDPAWPTMGVNARMMAAEILADVPVLRDGRSV